MILYFWPFNFEPIKKWYKLTLNFWQCPVMTLLTVLTFNWPTPTALACIDVSTKWVSLRRSTAADEMQDIWKSWFSATVRATGKMRTTVWTARDGTSNERNPYDLKPIFIWGSIACRSDCTVWTTEPYEGKNHFGGNLFTSAPVSISKLNGLELKLPSNTRFLIRDPWTVHHHPSSKNFRQSADPCS